MGKRNKIQQNIASIKLKSYDDENKKKNLFKEILSEYSSNSTLHGITYLGAKDKNLFEKIWWAIMFIISFVTCSYLINKTWIKWTENPVILSFENEQVSIWNIPFPAVTVCPLNKVIGPKYDYEKNFKNREKLTDKEMKLFCDISLICNIDTQMFDKPLPCSANVTDKSAITMMRKYSPTLNDTFEEVVWQSQEISISNFAEQITEDGICFTFNTLSEEDMYTNHIDADINYINLNIPNDGVVIKDVFSQTNKINTRTYPRRSGKDGLASGLSFTLVTNQNNMDYVCGLPISGFKIILHNPTENPKASQQYFLAPPNRKFAMIVSPDLTSTSKSLEDLSPFTRKCYFSNEKSLKFYKVYTQNNCRVECNANITKQYCGCVPFFMPREKNTAICGYNSLNCIKYVEDAILKLEVLKEMLQIPKEEREKLQYAYEIFNQCKCLPSCTSLQYSAETSQTESHLQKTYEAIGYYNATKKQVSSTKNTSGILKTHVDIFYKESQFFALQRSELFGQTDFLANCGGLLGLFMGFSLLSFMEIIYFFTIRLWFKYRSTQEM